MRSKLPDLFEKSHFFTGALRAIQSKASFGMMPHSEAKVNDARLRVFALCDGYSLLLIHEICLLPLTEMEHLVATLKQKGLCKTVHYKEMYIGEEIMNGTISGFP